MTEDKYCESYFQAKYGDRTFLEYRALFGHIATNFSPGRVLDVGAGSGLFVELLSRWGIDCEGIDGSVEAIEAAEKRYPGIQIKHGDLSNGLTYEKIFEPCVDEFKISPFQN